MAQNIPLTIKVSADGTIEAAANIDAVAKSAQHVGSVADSVAKKMAGMLSVGAFVAFGRASLNYVANLQDMADQFGVTASEAEGFIRQVRNVGGSAEKASSILAKLQAYQQQIGDTQSLSAFIDSIRESYERTGDFGRILEIVGTKNAAVFRAALAGMDGGLASFNDKQKNTTAALADYYGEAFQQVGDDTKSFFARGVVNAATYFKALKNGAAGWIKSSVDTSKNGFDAMGAGFKAFAKTYADEQRMIDKIQQDSIDTSALMAKSRQYNFTSKDFVGPISPYTFKDSAFVGPMQPKSATATMTAPIDKYEYQLAPFLSAISSQAIAAFQKYKAGGTTGSVEKQALDEARKQTRLQKELVDAIENQDGLQLDELGAF